MAKSRRELPHLYYPRANSVRVINSHNFGGGSGGAFSPSVNGKMPVAAWIPSRDDAGNGTTTLTDLAGSNNGTLTNMDPATDWVADMGAGGVRALDFENSLGQHVQCGDSTELDSSNLAVSIWIKAAVRHRNTRFFSYYPFGPTFWNSDQRFGIVNGGSVSLQETGAGSYFINTWYHLCVSRQESILTLFANGLLVAETSGFSGTFSKSGNIRIGRSEAFTGEGHSGLIDDIRVFDQALDATDIADLYASGNGRGVDAS